MVLTFLLLVITGKNCLLYCKFSIIMNSGVASIEATEAEAVASVKKSTTKFRHFIFLFFLFF